MTIGLPRAMLYHRYNVLWETFFKELNCDIVISDETNKKILDDGIKYSIDECCLPAKIFMGHVYSLIGRCDYILVPRLRCCQSKNDVCVKFTALYDIVKNTFESASILNYNVDALHGFSERKGFITMGKTLGCDPLKSALAYEKARAAQETSEKKKMNRQESLLETTGKLKILLVSHPYNNYDRLIGYPISQYIRELGGIPVYADAIDKKAGFTKSKEFSESLSWVFNRELVGSIPLLADKIDGAILLTAFPCGPDSLVNELIIRKMKTVPIMNLIVDELQGEAGMQTRVESFLDILKERASLKAFK